MFDYTQSPVRIRSDLPRAFRREFSTLASPGGSLDGHQRVAVARSARSAEPHKDPLHRFARFLYSDPAGIERRHVRGTAADSGDPRVVETIGVVARLSAIDRFHSVIGLPFEPLPEPIAGEPTGEITPKLKVRAGHVPMPPGSITSSLDLVPAESRALAAIDGPLYMTHEEMEDSRFGRDPGLHRPQLELIAARTSMVNECFY